MRYFLLLSFLLFLVISCSKKETIPSNVLPINTMKMIVWDLQVAGETANEKFPASKDSLRMETTSLYQQVFDKHKTQKVVFYNSFSYYESHPDFLKVLLDSTNNYGNRQKQNIYKKVY